MIAPSDFPDKLKRFIEDNCPGVKVDAMHIPVATNGKTTITVEVSVR